MLPILADADAYLAFSARKALRRIGDWKAAAAGLDSPDPKVRAGVLLAMELVYDTDAVDGPGRASRPTRRVPPASGPGRSFLLAQGHRKPIPWDGKWWGTQPARAKPPAKTIDWEGTPLVLAADPRPARRRRCRRSGSRPSRP